MEQDEKARRLAEQLRANLRRRKGQSHASRGGKADRRTGLALAGDADDQDAGGLAEGNSGEASGSDDSASN